MKFGKIAAWKEDAEPPENPEELWAYRQQKEEEWHLASGDECDLTKFRYKVIARSLEYGLRCLGLYERGFLNALQPKLVELQLNYPHLPKGLDGLRILMLSDLHLSARYPEFADATARLVEGLEADLCFMPGDFRFGHYGSDDHVYPQLEKILSAFKAHRGIYGVLGNHDFSYMIPKLSALGIHMLYNEGIPIQFGEDTLWLGGCDDPHRFKTDHLESALGQAPKEAFKVLLIHTPCRIEEARAWGTDLYLCGHTHGGQIRVPGLGAIRLNAACRPRFAYRQWRSEEMHGYTSPGLGTTDVPVRFGCPPEAQYITLRRL